MASTTEDVFLVHPQISFNGIISTGAFVATGSLQPKAMDPELELLQIYF
jgi:hypothetical protein